jgi:hypothetical protein
MQSTVIAFRSPPLSHLPGSSYDLTSITGLKHTHFQPHRRISVIVCEPEERRDQSATGAIEVRMPCGLYAMFLLLAGRPSDHPPPVSQVQILNAQHHKLRVIYFPSSACNRLMARCKSTLAAVSETHSKLSCICSTIPCKRAVDERS